jgi:ABC-type amino acid transport substrate-binding protein
MAHNLAGDLGVDLELVRTERADISMLFETGRADIVMSGLAITPSRAREWNFGTAPMDLTLGLLVPDYRRKQFSKLVDVQAMKDLTLGVVQADPAFDRRIEKTFPLAQVIRIESPRNFLRGDNSEIDAVIYSAEGGSAWTLIYPNFSIVVPQPLNAKVPLGYPLPKGDKEWSWFVSTWVELEKKNGTVDSLFEHWIRGGGAESTEPRWSIIRDVLHWVD